MKGHRRAQETIVNIMLYRCLCVNQGGLVIISGSSTSAMILYLTSNQLEHVVGTETKDSCSLLDALCCLWFRGLQARPDQASCYGRDHMVPTG